MTEKTNIGLPSQTIDAGEHMLRQLIGNTTIIYTALKQFHWNMRGIHFHEFHEFFETMSNALLPIIDDSAERIRALGRDAPGTMSEFLNDATRSEIANTPRKTEEMIVLLLEEYEYIIQHIRKNIRTCATLGDDGNADFLTGIMEQFEKTARMLRATIS